MDKTSDKILCIFSQSLKQTCRDKSTCEICPGTHSAGKHKHQYSHPVSHVMEAKKTRELHFILWNKAGVEIISCSGPYDWTSVCDSSLRQTSVDIYL